MLSTFCNYIYFRLAKVYYRWDGEEADTASIGIAMLLFALLNNCIILLRVLIYGYTPFSNIIKNYIVFFYLGVIFGILQFVIKVYKDYPIQKNEWNRIPQSKARLHTILIYVIGFIFILGIPILVFGNWWSWHK
ncbi:MAG: hypothetical protein Q4G27_02910 [Flavobacteriaceae bacterium]|nr:hypothetical protein [Flavobacteriaceae bacterium]